MPQTMTLDEKLAIFSMKACALRQAGDREGFHRVIRTAPMPSYLAKIFKEKVGAKPLLESGWNLSEAIVYKHIIDNLYLWKDIGHEKRNQ